jgi:hypothetical protein
MGFVAGKGTVIKVTISSTATAIPQATNITPPKNSRGEIDTTHLTSTWKSRLSSIPDGEECDFTLEWDPSDTTHQYLWTSFGTGDDEDWTILMTDGTTITFAGFIKSFPVDQIDIDKVFTIPVAIAINGAVTITPPA